MFSNHPNEHEMANVIHPEIKNQVVTPKENPDASIKNQDNNLAQVSGSNNAVIKNASSKKGNHPITKKDSPIVPVAKNELPLANNLPINNNQQPIANNNLPQTNNLPTTNNQQPATNSSASSLALTGKTNSSADFLSFKELAVEKLKEKTLDENTVASQKKNGRLKRFTGWDLAQIVSKGVSKLTGRDLEVKPTYNDEGVVTAYALGNGIERTTGR
jgi:hypothetical protein